MQIRDYVHAEVDLLSGKGPWCLLFRAILEPLWWWWWLCFVLLSKLIWLSRKYVK
jgi:hypothetical protein